MGAPAAAHCARGTGSSALARGRAGACAAAVASSPPAARRAAAAPVPPLRRAAAPPPRGRPGREPLAAAAAGGAAGDPAAPRDDGAAAAGPGSASGGAQGGGKPAAAAGGDRGSRLAEMREQLQVRRRRPRRAFTTHARKPTPCVPPEGARTTRHRPPLFVPPPSHPPTHPHPRRPPTHRRQRYGLAGVLAYGLLNTAYYSCMFLFVWVYVAKVPAGLGLAGAARKFLEVFALTWGGSQVGAPRAGAPAAGVRETARGQQGAARVRRGAPTAAAGAQRGARPARGQQRPPAPRRAIFSARPLPGVGAHRPGPPNPKIRSPSSHAPPARSRSRRSSTGCSTAPRPRAGSPASAPRLARSSRAASAWRCCCSPASSRRTRDCL
jgi:hypothetical protein